MNDFSRNSFFTLCFFQKKMTLSVIVLQSIQIPSTNIEWKFVAFIIDDSDMENNKHRIRLEIDNCHITLNEQIKDIVRYYRWLINSQFQSNKLQSSKKSVIFSLSGISSGTYVIMRITIFIWLARLYILSHNHIALKWQNGKFWLNPDHINCVRLGEIISLSCI